MHLALLIRHPKACIMAFDSIAAADARIEMEAEGFGFTEGLVWMKEVYILFTGVSGYVIYHLQDGHASDFT